MRLVETSVFTIVLIFFLLDQRNFIFLCWGEKKEIGKYLILTLLFTTFLYLNMSLAKHSCGVTVFLTGFYFTDKFAFGFFSSGGPTASLCFGGEEYRKCYGEHQSSPLSVMISSSASLRCLKIL